MLSVRHGILCNAFILSRNDLGVSVIGGTTAEWKNYRHRRI